MLTIPALKLPRPFAAIGERLPQWPHSLALATALNAALALRFLDAAELAALDGRLVRIRVVDAGATASVVMRAGRFHAAPSGSSADLVFAAPLSALLQMLTRQQDPDTLFFERALAIEGDTELGLIVKNLLDRIELPAFLRTRPRG